MEWVIARLPPGVASEAKRQKNIIKATARNLEATSLQEKILS
jgi:hypothetical protein